MLNYVMGVAMVGQGGHLPIHAPQTELYVYTKRVSFTLKSKIK
jgi:hypothetical protein